MTALMHDYLDGPINLVCHELTLLDAASTKFTKEIKAKFTLEFVCLIVLTTLNKERIAAEPPKDNEDRDIDDGSLSWGL